MPLLLYGFFAFVSSRQPCFDAEMLDTMPGGRLITKVCTQATAGIKLLPTEVNTDLLVISMSRTNIVIWLWDGLATTDSLIVYFW